MQLGGDAAYELFSMEELNKMDENTLYLHMYRAVGLVYAAKEAMWDELKALMSRGPDSLAEYGWDESEYNEEASRERFDAMFERYKA